LTGYSRGLTRETEECPHVIDTSPSKRLSETLAAMILTSFTSELHRLHRIKEDLNTSPFLIPNKHQRLLSLRRYPASRIVIPLIYVQREEHRLGTAILESRHTAIWKRGISVIFRFLYRSTVVHSGEYDSDPSDCFRPLGMSQTR
jgi:hypothetical protein